MHYVSDIDSMFLFGSMSIPACIMMHSTLIFHRMALLRLMGGFLFFFSPSPWWVSYTNPTLS